VELNFNREEYGAILQECENKKKGKRRKKREKERRRKYSGEEIGKRRDTIKEVSERKSKQTLIQIYCEITSHVASLIW